MSGLPALSAAERVANGAKSLCKSAAKRCDLRTKLCSVCLFYVALALTVLITDTVNATPTRLNSTLNMETVFYVGSIGLSALTVPEALYAFVNVLRRVRTGFVAHATVQFLWLLLSVSYAIFFFEQRGESKPPAENADSVTMVTVMLALLVLVLQLWFTKISVLYIVKADAVERAMASRAAAIRSGIDADRGAGNRGNPSELNVETLPPAYEVAKNFPKLSDEDAPPPDYERAVRCLATLTY